MLHVIGQGTAASQRALAPLSRLECQLQSRQRPGINPRRTDRWRFTLSLTAASPASAATPTTLLAAANASSATRAATEQYGGALALCCNRAHKRSTDLCQL